MVLLVKVYVGAIGITETDREAENEYKGRNEYEIQATARGFGLVVLKD